MEKKDTNHKCEDKRQKPEQKNGAKKTKWYIWPLTITLITFVLSAAFALGTELVITKTHMIFAICVLFLLVTVSIAFDAIAVAVTACDTAPLAAMAAKKVRGSRHAIKLVHNADKVASICADVIGDICGIISGACGAAIAFMIIIASGGAQLFVSIIVSAVIASITVSGKAIMKSVAINHSTAMVVFVGKLLSFFRKEGNK